MRFISTRGQAPELDFAEVVLAGLASDGGLYVPKNLPQFTPADFSRFATLNYCELALEIIRPFTQEIFDDATLKAMIADAYSEFRHSAIAPITQLDRQHFVLELFHGPTLAFKDFALQLLGRIMQKLLAGTAQKSVVLGATSGDTGSAAIAGLRGKQGIDIVILYPSGRTSEVQRKQMTSVADSNVHAIAIAGDFDDCQNLVKRAFADEKLRASTNLLAVNSINFARIMAQIVYYIYAACALGAPARKVNFCVPTGNFGDIYAGYLARKMGLPMGRLIIASNRNDILTRCVQSGIYAAQGVTPSHSPSMDIQISSNFERLLFDLYDRDSAQINSLMQQFRDTGSITLSAVAKLQLQAIFSAHAVDDLATLQTMQQCYADCGYLPDPHTAVGLAAAHGCAQDCGNEPIITLATAHPAKFPEALALANLPNAPLPAHLADLYTRPERIQNLENDYNQLTNLIGNL